MRTGSYVVSSEKSNSATRFTTYFMTNVGIELKFRGTKKIDYLISVQQDFSQSPYLDGEPFHKSYHSFSSFSVGVSYNLCSAKKKIPIDWTRNFHCPSISYKSL